MEMFYFISIFVLILFAITTWLHSRNETVYRRIAITACNTKRRYKANV